MFAARRYEDAANALYAMTSPPNEARYVLIAALGRIGRIEEALQVREKFFELAREEMPNYPGEKLLDWEPIIRRMQGSHSSEDHEHLLESLKLVGWD